MLHASRHLHRARAALLLLSLARIGLTVLGVDPCVIAAFDDLRDVLGTLMLALEHVATEKSRALPDPTSICEPAPRAAAPDVPPSPSGALAVLSGEARDERGA